MQVGRYYPEQFRRKFWTPPFHVGLSDILIRLPDAPTHPALLLTTASRGSGTLAGGGQRVVAGGAEVSATNAGAGLAMVFCRNVASAVPVAAGTIQAVDQLKFADCRLVSADRIQQGFAIHSRSILLRISAKQEFQTVCAQLRPFHQQGALLRRSWRRVWLDASAFEVASLQLGFWL